MECFLTVKRHTNEFKPNRVAPDQSGTLKFFLNHYKQHLVYFCSKLLKPDVYIILAAHKKKSKQSISDD